MVSDQTLAVENEISLNIYPNPTMDFIKINNEEPVNVKIINLNGKVVKSKNLKNGKIDISDLASGIYLLEVQLNGKIYKQKIRKAN